MDANRTTPVYELKDELARLCLPSASRDAGRKLAWTNSVCILFLLVGIIGARRARIAIHPVPPIAEVIPAIIEPLALPPQETTENKAQTEAAPDDTPRVAVAIPQVPSVSFAIPTIGALAVPTALAALPLRPLHAAAQIGSLNDTGAGGDRPEPPYPPIARAQGEQGTVVVLLGADAAGNLTSIQIKTPSGSSILDRSTLDFLKRHWRLPAGNGDRLFETSITYQLQLN
jgi:protein TonB